MMPTIIDKPIKVMLVAGEHSGDILGAGLIKRLKERYPNATFSGIGGPRMLAEGFQSYYPMSKLSVFGLFEVIKHLPELLGIRKHLKKIIISENPDVFIGIDAPDFNLKLERELYKKGIKTVHYVSPTVWAWRPKRIKKLIGSLNALLCIFPFEETYFKDTAVPAYFIGHPLADKHQHPINTQAARQSLGLHSEQPVLTIMPGSRLGELERHSFLFLQTAYNCSNNISGLKILVPMPDQVVADKFEEYYRASGLTLDLEIKVRATTEMIAAANMVLVASGTATLEVMLFKKPMVVAYKLSALTAWVIKTFDLLKAPFVSMPNLIAGKELVKEYLQDDIKVATLTEELVSFYQDKDKTQTIVNEFNKMKIKLTRQANIQAANIVSGVINGDVSF
ncbi:lipid-A-disaccharide synthase [uncultured Cycloclasticus sp.]|uniref:lipid-A-disaccharide synthase n=1 Tax=uncultured Cycloclasticus sp. TaxID=172194 RepID=UPI00258B22B6|nr:lipid-A-disaccharide synthase [uncultured Cycloclasticus sp.]